MDDLLKLVTTLGFPAAICAYVLVRVDKSIREHTAALFELRVAIARLDVALQRWKGED